MNSLERVKAALKFNHPDKVPIWSLSPGELDNDIFEIVRVPSKKWQPGHRENEQGLFPFVGDDLIIESKLWSWEKPDWAKDPKYEDWLKIEREEIDEWGAIWRRRLDKTLGHPGRPSLTDYSEIDEYLETYTPIINDKDCYFGILDHVINDKEPFASLSELSDTMGNDKYHMALLDLGPLHIAANMRGFTDFLSDHRRNKKELKYLLEYIANHIIQYQRMYVKFGANPHGFIMYEDFGTQQGPFFSPRLFKDFYESVYRRIIDSAHELGCEFHMHSCGKIDPLIPVLIDWGLDAIELDSPRMTGYPSLSNLSHR